MDFRSKLLFVKIKSLEWVILLHVLYLNQFEKVLNALEMSSNFDFQ